MLCVLFVYFTPPGSDVQALFFVVGKRKRKTSFGPPFDRFTTRLGCTDRVSRFVFLPKKNSPLQGKAIPPRVAETKKRTLLSGRPALDGEPDSLPRGTRAREDGEEMGFLPRSTRARDCLVHTPRPAASTPCRRIGTSPHGGGSPPVLAGAHGLGVAGALRRKAQAAPSRRGPPPRRRWPGRDGGTLCARDDI